MQTPPSVELLRKMHQELRKLTAAASLWLLPAYLCYALTEEAKYSRMEISFFILSLAALAHAAACVVIGVGGW